MDKALELLEKYCQWIAVALGGLFLAWILWSYVLMTPTEVPKGSVVYTPGDVDDHIAKNYAEPLNAEITRQEIERPPVVANVNPLDAWMPLIKDGTDKPIPALASSRWISSATDDEKIGGGGKDDGIAINPVTELPVPPPTYVTDLVSRRVYHGDPPPPAAAPGQPQPPAPPPVALVPGQVPPGKDLSYVRLSYRIPAFEMTKVFQTANVPAGAQTAVIAVKLIRQELLPNGQWGKEYEVPYLKNNVWPFPLPKTPAEVTWFRGWSDSPQGQNDLLRPLFYPVVFGEGPWDPSMDDTMPKYDAKAIAAEKARIAKEREAARKAAQPAPTPRSSGRMPRMPRGGPDGEPVIPDAQRPATLGDLMATPFYQIRPGMPGMPGIPGMPGMPPADPDSDEGMGGMPQPGIGTLAPGQTPPPAEALPQPNFNPANEKDFLCWAYDETVQEGHTYRYQVLYALRSPVYESNVTKPPELAQQFAIWSKPDEKAWSWPIEVKPTAEYYLATNNWPEGRTPNNIKIDVFKWAQGKWQSSTFTVSAGDKVGENQNGIDYSTNVTVVDLKYDSRGNNGQGRPYVLLLNDDGRLTERDPSVDRNNNRMLQLRQFIQLMNPPGAPGAPGAPGVPGAVGGAGGPPPIAGGPTQMRFEVPTPTR